MICAIYNCNDLDCIEYVSICEFYGIMTIINHASNEMQYEYPMFLNDVDKFFLVVNGLCLSLLSLSG